jgi:heme-degrading monooxygenase HmoA
MATIAAGTSVFTLINTFTVEPERQDDVVASLRDVTERVMRDVPGFVSACVHKSLDGKHVANYVQWRSLADFQAMFVDPRAKAHMEDVRSMALDVKPIIYEVAYVGERQTLGDSV